jgi:hypothetical protein
VPVQAAGGGSFPGGLASGLSNWEVKLSDGIICHDDPSVLLLIVRRHVKPKTI